MQSSSMIGTLAGRLIAAALALVPAMALAVAPPATQPASLDKILDDLARVDPKALADRLGTAKQQVEALTAETAALKEKLAQNEAQLARLAAHLRLLEALVNARSVVPVPAAPTMVAAAPATQPAATQPAMAAAMVATAKPAPPKPAAPPMAAQPAINFADHILPIINEKCIGCHNADKARGGLNLATFNDLMAGGSSGKVIEPGSPDGSRFYRMVAHQEQPYMPLMQSKMDDAKIETIRKWIEGGALPDAKAKPAAMKPAAPQAAPTNGVAVDLETGPMPGALPKVEVRTVVRPPPAVALAASPNADLLAVGGEGQIHFYRISTRTWLGTVDFPDGRIEYLDFSADGAALVAAGGSPGKSGEVILYDVESGQVKGRFDKLYDTVLAAAVSPDGGLVAVGGTNSKVRVFNTYDGSKVFQLTAHNDWVTALRFSPDGLLLASADRAGGLYVWEADTGREVHNLRGHTGAVTSIAFRPDSLSLVSAGKDGTARTWEMEDGRQTKQWPAHDDGCLSVEFSADNQLVTSGADGRVRLWDANGKHIRDLPRQSDWTYRAVFSPDAKSVIAGTFDGAVAFFDTASGKALGAASTSPTAVK